MLPKVTTSMKKVIKLARSSMGFLGVFLTFCCCLFPLSALAQDEGWSNPINISNSPGNSSFPSLAVDSAGNVHLVWIEEVEAELPIVLYTSLQEGTWSESIDIFASGSYDPIQNVQLLGDSQGNLHIFLTWKGIQYSKANASEAGSARSWLPPELLVPPTNYQTSPHVTITTDDQIHLVYAIEVGAGSGVYYMHSTDDGENWDDPIPVFLNSSPNLRVTGPRIAVVGQGQVHVVWVETNYPETFPPLGIRYASSPDGSTWSEPRSLADGPYSDLEILVVGESDLHVVWSGTTPDRYKFYAWSKDTGNTWTDAWRNSELGGYQGSPALAADSLGRIYWLKVGTVYGLPDGTYANKDSLHENIFVNGIWSNGTVLLNGETNIQNQMNVTAVILNGNQLHTAVMNPLPITDKQYQFDIFYLSKSLDAPAILPQPQPTATAIDPPEQTPTITKDAIATVPPTVSINPNPETVMTNWMGVLAGLLPVALLLLIIVFVIRRKR